MIDEVDTDLYVPAGHLLMTSSGEYSDYRTGGCFVTLEPLYRSKLQELAAQVNADHARTEAADEAAYETWEELRQSSPPDTDVGKPPSRLTSYGSQHGEFIAAMIRNGWLLAVTYTELHIGSYGDLDLSL